MELWLNNKIIRKIEYIHTIYQRPQYAQLKGFDTLRWVDEQMSRWANRIVKYKQWTINFISFFCSMSSTLDIRRWPADRGQKYKESISMIAPCYDVDDVLLAKMLQLFGQMLGNWNIKCVMWLVGRSFGFGMNNGGTPATAWYICYLHVAKKAI